LPEFAQADGAHPSSDTRRNTGGGDTPPAPGGSDSKKVRLFVLL
jgi:hypothetical protein